MLLRPLKSDSNIRIEFQKRLPVYYLYFYGDSTNVTCKYYDALKFAAKLKYGMLQIEFKYNNLEVKI